jgi:hypothetical protein
MRQSAGLVKHVYSIESAGYAPPCNSVKEMKNGNVHISMARFLPCGIRILVLAVLHLSMHLTIEDTNPVESPCMAVKRGIFERVKGKRHLVDSLDRC